MAKRARSRDRRPLPPPLPPERRTVGQLVAEAIRLYASRFWPSLALGLAPAGLAVFTTAVSGWPQTVATLAAGPAVLSASLVGATLVGAGGDRRPRALALALLAGIPAFLPFVLARVLVFPGSYLLALAWYAAFALAVPAVLVERRGVGDALRRALALARADVVHALGSVATLVIVIVLSSLVLFVLLAGFGDQALPFAAFLALVVLAPLFFLGTALLYFDQRARIAVGSPAKRRRRGDADLHHADRAGPADAEVEPGAPARGQP